MPLNKDTKPNDTIKTSDTVFLKKYTSHFIWKGSKGLLKVLLCERWVGGWTELQQINPHSYGHNSISFPFSWAAQPGAWGPNLSGCWFSLPHLISNRLNFLCTELYNNWRPLFFLRVSQYRTQFSPSRLYPDIPRLDAPVIYTGAFLFWQRGPGSICYCNT